MSQPDIIMGIHRDWFNESASRYAKNTIGWWLIAGIIWSFIAHNHPMLDIFLLILPGVFVISILSIPLFWVRIQKYKRVPDTNNVLVLSLFTVTSIIDFLFPIVMAIVAVNLLNLW